MLPALGCAKLAEYPCSHHNKLFYFGLFSAISSKNWEVLQPLQTHAIGLLLSHHAAGCGGNTLPVSNTGSYGLGKPASLLSPQLCALNTARADRPHQKHNKVITSLRQPRGEGQTAATRQTAWSPQKSCCYTHAAAKLLSQDSSNSRGMSAPLGDRPHHRHQLALQPSCSQSVAAVSAGRVRKGACPRI